MMRKSYKLILLGVALLVLFFIPALQAEEIKTDFTKWKSVVGDWKVLNGEYLNGDGVEKNTNAYLELKQDGKEFIYEWTVEFKETTFSLGPAAGLHILCDAATDANRGNSYLVFQDNGFIRVYKAAGSSLPKVIDFPVTAEVGKTYSYRVEFNTQTGLMKFFRDGKEVGQWKDLMPLKSGKYISVRTNGTKVAFKEVKVTIK